MPDIDLLPSIQRGMPGFPGHVADFMGRRLPRFCEQLNAVVQHMKGLGFGSYSARSDTALTLTLGLLQLQIQPKKSFVPGQDVLIADADAPADRRMVGIVTAYDPATGSLEIEVERLRGSGSGSDWHVAIAAAEPPAEASEFTVGSIYQGFEPPAMGQWVEAGNVYLRATYPVLADLLKTQANSRPSIVRSGTFPVTMTIGAQGAAALFGVFVALASATTYVVSRNFAETWSLRTLPSASNQWSHAVAGNGKILILSPTHAATTVDGETWSVEPITNPAGVWHNVRFDRGWFRHNALVSGAYVAYKSKNGFSWVVDTEVLTTAVSVMSEGNGILAAGTFDGRQHIAGTTGSVNYSRPGGVSGNVHLPSISTNQAQPVSDGYGTTVVFANNTAFSVLRAFDYDPATQFYVPLLSRLTDYRTSDYKTWVRAA